MREREKEKVRKRERDRYRMREDLVGKVNDSEKEERKGQMQGEK